MTDPPDSAQPGGTSGTTTSGLTQLKPVDGLYLRAEHLATIQDYARRLAYAGGLAGGSGVVYGYEAKLTGNGSSITIGPGLAIDGRGRPLLSEESIEISLAEVPSSEGGRYWLIEVAYAGPVDAGDPEPVYGSACPDPCSGSGQRAYQQNRVEVRIRPQDLSGLSGPAESQRRGYLASRYFEAERRNGHPWLTPEVASAPPNGSIAGLETRPWAQPQPASAPGGAVYIGALLRVNGAWVLDVWLARRDLDPTPPVAGWMGRLGFRPWNIFAAQLLQFQDQLRGPSITLPSLDQLYAALSGAVPAPSQLAIRAQLFARLELQWPIDATPSLPDRGFVELPPAGFVTRPEAPNGDQLRVRLEALFGGRLTVNVRRSSADAALRAVAAAQHLDRIPLTEGLDPRPTVDVWVPDVPADLPALRVDNYGWAAFVRAPVELPSATVIDPPDKVDVYVGTMEGTDTPEQLVKDMPDNLPKVSSRVAELSYPARVIGTPMTEDGYLDIEREVAGRRISAVVGVARTDSRRPTIVARAVMIAARFDASSKLGDSLPVIFGVVRPADPEIAVLLLEAPPKDGGEGEGDLTKTEGADAGDTRDDDVVKTAGKKARATKGTATKRSARKRSGAVRPAKAVTVPVAPAPADPQ